MRPFLAQLRQRNVFRVATAYIVVGWVILEFGSLTFDNFGAPEWVIKVFSSLVFLGFPVACLLAWAVEATPEGLRVTRDTDPEANATPRKGDLLWAGLLAITLLVAMVNFISYWRMGTSGAAHTSALRAPAADLGEIPGIAVLPFVDMSESGDQQYLGDGIAEELLNALVSVGGINVAARTSSFSFHGKDVPIREIGSTLGVKYVLEGSVRRHGEQLRVTAQLIDVDSGFHLFSRSYDRNSADLFAVQDEIAGEIAQALLPSLDIEGGLVSKHTENMEAYNLRMKGRYAFFHATPGSLLASIDYLSRAVAVDPAYWSAWADLGYANAYMSIFVREPVPYTIRAQEAATRSLEHQPDTPAALLISAMIANTVYYDHQSAEDFYRRAGESSSNLAYLSFNKAFMHLFPQGRYQEAIELLEQVVEGDPLAPPPRVALLTAYRLAGQMEKALPIADQMVAEHETAAWLWSLVLTYVKAGDLDKAALVLERLERSTGENVTLAQYSRIKVLSAQGKEQALRDMLASILARDRERQDVSPLVIGAAYLALGQEDLALDWYYRLFDSRSALAVIVLAGTEREFTEIENNTRYQALLRRMNLPLVTGGLARKLPPGFAGS